MRGYQNWHMDNNGWRDIGYSFVIGGDGNVYEGAGWNKLGTHTKGLNSRGYGISFIGDFMRRNPTARAQQAFHDLVDVN